jgi:hypothetical protein
MNNYWPLPDSLELIELADSLISIEVYSRIGKMATSKKGQAYFLGSW